MITITEEQLENGVWGEVAMLMQNLEGYRMRLPGGGEKRISLEDINQFIYDDKELCEALDKATILALHKGNADSLYAVYMDAATSLIEAAFRSVCEVV